MHYLNNPTAKKKFDINFLRSHLKRPEHRNQFQFNQPQDIISFQSAIRIPSFIIARKQDKYWRITEKIFTEEL